MFPIESSNAAAQTNASGTFQNVKTNATIYCREMDLYEPDSKDIYSFVVLLCFRLNLVSVNDQIHSARVDISITNDGVFRHFCLNY